jgi:acyl dehydratase
MSEPSDVAALREEWVGRSRPHVRLHVELGMVQAFARAVHEVSPVWFDERAARAAGFPAVPAVPAFVFSIPYLAAARRPEGAPAGDTPDEISPLLALLAGPRGITLHADQAFTYERPVFVGDTLGGAEVVVDVDRAGSEHPLWLVRTRTVWTDATGALVVTSDKTVAARYVAA